MDYSRIVVADFETEAIKPRPAYPPEPCGVALRSEGFLRGYLAWGHPSGNNARRGESVELLRTLWEDDGAQLLFHNASFDLSVAYERLSLPPLPWRRVHDTMVLLFLHDPHSPHLGLKEAAQALLDWPAEERDELHEWIWDHRKELVAQYGGRITRAKSGEGSMGAWISKAPGELVGRYATGDVDRTAALFRFLYPRVVAAGMGPAYDRERRLMPILADNERRGLRVAMLSIRDDEPTYYRALLQVESQMRHYLQAPGLNFDADKDVAAIFAERDVVRPECWMTTPKSGQLSVAKDALPPDSFTDPLFASAWGYRNRLVTCLKMFVQPWLDQAEANNGYIHTSWNQVRGSRGGARTGRPSMTKPNLLNVSKKWEGRPDGYAHPAALDLPPLPEVRKYILPDEGDLFVHRDFDGQELRIFAHFESGQLASLYQSDPDLDPHEWVRQEIVSLVGRDLERTPVKILNFQSLYGGGVTAIAAELRCSRAEAQQFKAFHDRALPGRKVLYEEILRLVRRGEPIRTWGGRLYHVEPPSRVNGRLQTWEYKLINYLIQGSAADVTKECICRWYEGGGASNGARFLLTVYDEINLSAPARVAVESMEYLREVMNSIELDVPMRSSGKIGKSWGTLEETP